MGAVRVRVRLTNGVDEGLVRTGQLRPEDVRSFEGEALVDTGAVKSVIPGYVMQKLGLPAIEKTPVQFADGRTELVEMTGPITMRISDRRSNEDAYVLGDEILIGQTALESMDLRGLSRPKAHSEPQSIPTVPSCVFSQGSSPNLSEQFSTRQ